MHPHTAFSPELIDRIRRVYAQYGISDLENVGKPMSMDALVSLLGEAQAHIPEMQNRVVPSSFDPDDENLIAFPLPLSYTWSSCERALVRSRPRGVMMRAPLFWQLEAPLHAACRAAGAPIFVNDQANMPVGGAAIQLADTDAVVTSANDAVAFAAYLSEKKMPHPRLWILISSLEEYLRKTDHSREGIRGTVVEEVHLFPGLVLLEQCEHLADARGGFHASGTFHWEIGSEECLITSLQEDAPIPFARLTLPLALRKRGTCGCGNPVFERA